MKPTDLRGILRYIPSFRDKVFVLSLDGAVVLRETFALLLQDIAVLRSLNINVILVHGAAEAIEQLAEKQGKAPSNLDGTGVTDAETLELALNSSNRLTHEILEGLSMQDLRAACTNGITAHPLGILRGVDYLHTGRVERTDVTLFHTLLSQGIIPIIQPLGFDGDGNTYRVNSDAVAVAVASALKAVKLVFITTRDGLIQRDQLIREVRVSELDRMLSNEESSLEPEILSKARHAARACHSGVPRVHIINGCVEEGLLAEVFSNEGIGTLIYANAYQQIRQAMKKDSRSLLRLTKESVANEELAKRSRSTLEKNIGDYYLYELDGNPVGCVALHVYPETNQGELAYLYVSPSHENQGIGRKLVQFVENRARELGLTSLITLSTQAFTYFKSKAGFREGSVKDLPPARQISYDQEARRSKILVKPLK